MNEPLGRINPQDVHDALDARLAAIEGEAEARDTRGHSGTLGDTSETINAINGETNVIPLVDTREKLEADIRKCCTGTFGRTLMYPDSANHTIEFLSTTVESVIGWLDRQAAITERETLHSHPMCAGSDACSALNRPIGESADRETPDTAGIGASKYEIRDFDVWSVAYEIYCAGGYVDNGNEPDPPTDGIRELLDRQAAITERECRDYENELRKQHHKRVDALKAKVDELTKRLEQANAGYVDCAACPITERAAEKMDELTEERDRLREEVAFLEGQCEECGLWPDGKDFEQTHMRLPVDADGAPIKPGDVLEYDKTRTAKVSDIRMRGDEKWFLLFDGALGWWSLGECRHVQPDTVESLLAEFQRDTLTTQGEYAGDVIDADECRRDLKEHVEEYAERIRKAVDR